MREAATFSPPSSPDKHARNVRAVDEIRTLRRRAGRWRLLFLLLALTSVAGAAWARHAWQSRGTADMDLDDPALTPLNAMQAPAGQNILAPLPKDGPGRRGTITGWRIHLGNRTKQGVVPKVTADGPTSLELTSSDLSDMWLHGPTIQVQSGMKLTGTMRLFVREMEGEVTLNLIVNRVRDGHAVSEIHTANPGRKRRDGWLSAQKTVTVPAGATSMEYEIRGRFRGAVLVNNLTLRIKPAAVPAADTAADDSLAE